MTPAAARQRILDGIASATAHREPFRYGGILLTFRLPTALQVQVASGMYAKFGAHGLNASLACQCTEFQGRRVFNDGDLVALLQDEPHGFVATFARAYLPFLTSPIALPTLAVGATSPASKLTP